MDSDNDYLDLGNGLNVLSELCIVYEVQIESATCISNYIPSYVHLIMINVMLHVFGSHFGSHI